MRHSTREFVFTGILLVVAGFDAFMPGTLWMSIVTASVALFVAMGMFLLGCMYRRAGQ